MTNTINASSLVGKYINRYGYSDINPVGKIIKTVGKCSVLVAKIEASENKIKMNFVPGGFSAVCTNQNEQEYDFTETSELITIRISKSYLRQYKIEDEPRKFYDYNF